MFGAFFLGLLRTAWPYLLLTAVVGGAAWYLHHKGYEQGRASNQATIAAQKATIAEYQDANDKAQTAISRLTDANNAWAAKCEGSLIAQKAAAKAAMDHADKLQRDLSIAQRKLHDLYATNPTAHAWSADAVPIAVPDSLRAAQADHPHANGHG